MLNGYYVGMLGIVDRIRAALGLAPLGKRERVAQAYIRAFYDPERALFRDSETSSHVSELGNILPPSILGWTRARKPTFSP